MIKRILVVSSIIALVIGLLADQLHLAVLIVIPTLAIVLLHGVMSNCGGIKPRFSDKKEQEKL